MPGRPRDYGPRGPTASTGRASPKAPNGGLKSALALYGMGSGPYGSPTCLSWRLKLSLAPHHILTIAKDL